MLHHGVVEIANIHDKVKHMTRSSKTQHIFLWALLVIPACVVMIYALSLVHFNNMEPKGNLPAAVGILPAIVDSLQPEPMVDDKPVFYYIEIIDGCDASYAGPCVNMRLGPSTHTEVAVRLRTGIVLKVEETTVSGDGHDWYKIIFDGEIRYPDRVKGDWYVAVDPTSVRPFKNVGDIELAKNSPKTAKRIVIDIGDQTLTAYDGDEIFMQELVSTGLDDTPTPAGTFSIFRKTPSRYMQGPIPGVSEQEYDLPGVPWNLYFTYDGAVIHGAYWHNNFGRQWSHGCVNLSLENARKLYEWADIGTIVSVQY